MAGEPRGVDQQSFQEMLLEPVYLVCVSLSHIEQNMKNSNRRGEMCGAGEFRHEFARGVWLGKWAGFFLKL